MVRRRVRQKHSGTIYREGRYWVAAVTVAGRKHRKRCGTQAEALKARQLLVERVQVGQSLTAATFGGFRERWLDHCRRRSAVKTAELYEYGLAPFDDLRNSQLADITAGALQHVIDGLAGRKAQLAYDVARRMLDAAVQWECLTTNPLRRLARPRHERRTIDPFDRAEVLLILEHFAGTQYSAAVRLALACGLRAGELWGLQWGDWQGEELTIQRQACESSSRVEIKKPKTAAGVRRLLLPDSVVDDLGIRRACALRDGHAASPWIFCNARGGVTRRTAFAARHWTPALKTLGLRHRGFHHARHTAASLLLNSGVPLTVVSRTLGHASPAVTLSIYAHVMTSDLMIHRNAFDSLVDAARAS